MKIGFRFEHFDRQALVDVINYGTESIGPLASLEPFDPEDKDRSGTFGYNIYFRLTKPGFEISGDNMLPGMMNAHFDMRKEP